ncbi:hypothetical protein [Paenibacillus eucommiae]|uniref:Uncharacterized protein n=1 Tax=Paenibacillus eucommiae TaxID=1355755 RepID=A0ABS4IU15_9BACL|nr:hypothetical protein [Paenibacillus eucommiae]MBP1990356.1 hypothetical protein [Paenibacillus eucommiae]
MREVAKAFSSIISLLFYNLSVLNGKFFNTQSSTLDYYVNIFLTLIHQSGYMYITIPMDEDVGCSTFAKIMKEEAAPAEVNYVKTGEKFHILESPTL